MSEQTPEGAKGRLDALVGRLIEHAELHEQHCPQDEEQQQWARDLREAAGELARLRDALETVRDKLRVDDPHGLYDLVCNALRPNTSLTGGCAAKNGGRNE